MPKCTQKKFEQGFKQLECKGRRGDFKIVHSAKNPHDQIPRHQSIESLIVTFDCQGYHLVEKTSFVTIYFEGIRQSFFHSWMSDIDRARQILFAVRRLTFYLEIYLADSKKKCVRTHNMITRVSVEKLVIVPLPPSWMALRDICRKEAGRREITWG